MFLYQIIYYIANSNLQKFYIKFLIFLQIYLQVSEYDCFHLFPSLNKLKMYVMISINLN